MVLKIPQNSQEIVFTRLSWLQHKYFSEHFFKSFRNTFFTEHLQTTASDFNSIFLLF